jgi:hypothetical protein
LVYEESLGTFATSIAFPHVMPFMLTLTRRSTMTIRQDALDAPSEI